MLITQNHISRQTLIMGESLGRPGCGPGWKGQTPAEGPVACTGIIAEGELGPES